MKFNVLTFGLTVGLYWGLGLFFLTWWVILFDGATGQANFISQIYRGYNVSVAGSFIGLAWALVDGFIGGVIFAWLYNLILGKVKPDEQ